MRPSPCSWRTAFAAPGWRAPESTTGPSNIAWIHFYRDGDLEPLREFLAGQETGWVTARWNLHMFDRDFDAAPAVLEGSDIEVFTGQYGISPRSELIGITQSMLGNEDAARESLESARATLEGMLPELDHDPRVHVALGETYALLGMRDEAIREGNRAVELIPPEMDAMIGTQNLEGIARIHAILGEADEACQALETLLSTPSTVNRPLLRTAPVYDGIRDDPAFQALLQG